MAISKTDADLDTLLAQLFHHKDELPIETVQAIVAYGNEAVEPLREILHCRDHYGKTASYEWWAAIHAAHLLAAIGTDRVVRILMDAAEMDLEHYLKLMPGLFGAIGPVAIPHLCRVLLDCSPSYDYRPHQWIAGEGLTAVALRHPGSRDEIVQFLRTSFEHEVEYSAPDPFLCEALLHNLGLLKDLYVLPTVRLASIRKSLPTIPLPEEHVHRLLKRQRPVDEHFFHDPMEFYRGDKSKLPPNMMSLCE